MLKYYKYELNMWIMNILSILLFIIPFIIIISFGYEFNFNINGIVFIGLILYLIIHEIFHGIGYALFVKDKKNIKFGITLEKGVLYAMCQEKLNKKAIIISLLFPLIFLTIIPLPFSLIFHLDWLTLYAITNFAGAIGDMLMVILMSSSPKDMQYLDYNNDVGAYILSKNDMSNIKSFGFRLTETGNAKDKKPDKSIKRIYISKTSMIILGLLLFIAILSIIVG